MIRRCAFVLVLMGIFMGEGLAQEVHLSDASRRLDLLAAQPLLPDFQSASDNVFVKKSVPLAVLYSLLLPGMGELYAGGFSSGRYFLGAEAGLWTTYAIVDIRGNSIKDDGRMNAAVHSGLNPTGKNDQFYVDVSNFMTVDDYNAKKMRDRNLAAVYDPAAGYGWSWDSDANRAAFHDLRIRADDVLNNRKFVVLGVLINHLASAVNAARVAISHNKAAANGLGDLQIGASVMSSANGAHGICVNIQRTF